MNTGIIGTFGIAAAALMALGESRGQDQPTWANYSGKATVAALGEVRFPQGEWSLEFQRIQSSTNDLGWPDYFVFKRVGHQLERLTFLRYPVTTTPKQLGRMIDGVGETLGDGIPAQLQEAPDQGGTIHPMRLRPSEPVPTERRIEYSFIHTLPPPAPAWLCHSILFLHKGRAWIIAHSSTSVIDPEAVGEVQFRSRFLAGAQLGEEQK